MPSREREREIAAFLAASGADSSSPRVAIAGDASSKRFWRVRTQDGPVLLMDFGRPNAGAGESNGESEAAKFAKLARHLLDCGLSAPRIRGLDAAAGLALVEDFGDALVAQLIERDPGRETELYSAATDMLAALRDVPANPVPVYGPAEMAEAIDVAFTEYAAPLTLEDPDRGLDRARESLRIALDQVVGAEPPAFCLRDCHAQNMFWLPEREGAARVGLIDFQDAVAAHPAYDLVSLLDDARRDVSPATRDAMTERYMAATGSDGDRDAFLAACAALTVQRNLRILGVFARLARKFAKPAYLRLLPRVWGHVLRGLRHPALRQVESAIRDSVPEPSDGNVARLAGQ